MKNGCLLTIVSNFIIGFVGNFSPYPLYMLGTTVKCCTFFIFYPLILYPLTNPRSVLFTGSEAANASRNFNELNRAIQREVTRLSERWSNLISQTDRWQRRLDEVLPKVKKSKYIIMYSVVTGWVVASLFSGSTKDSGYQEQKHPSRHGFSSFSARIRY